MKVSIIIPLYNSEKYIAETIESALAQTWKDKEIIVINDGSTDDSLSIAQYYADKGVKVYSQENKGLPGARNAGLDYATGDYINYLDADDLMQPNKIEVQMNYILQNNLGENDVVYSYMEVFKNDINHLGKSHSFADKSYGNKFGNNVLDFQNDMLISKRIVQCAQYLMHRNLIERVGRWNEALRNSEDVEFYTKIMAVANNIIYVPGTTMYYRMTIGGQSTQFKPQDCEYRLQALTSMATIMLKNNYSEQTINALSYYFNFYITFWFPGNKHTLKRLEKFMKENKIPYHEKGFSKKHKFLLKTLGWRRTLLLKKKLKY